MLSVGCRIEDDDDRTGGPVSRRKTLVRFVTFQVAEQSDAAQRRTQAE